jgi:hypothetical protein
MTQYARPMLGQYASTPHKSTAMVEEGIGRVAFGAHPSHSTLGTSLLQAPLQTGT